jgi:hypothetical protein
MRRLAVCGAAFGVIVFVLAFGADRASGQAQTIYFCHATASTSNPYNLISGSPQSIIQAGHGHHTGPIFPATDPVTGAWGDIIPPFDYPGGHFNGLNWTVEGMNVLNAGCKVINTPTPEVEEPTTTLPPTTTSVPSTTTSAPSGSTSQPTTSTTFPATTPTTSPSPGPPPVTDPASGVETFALPTEAVVVDRGDQINVLGPLSPAEEAQLEDELDVAAGQPTLAETGVGLWLDVLSVGGFLLLCAGLTLSAHSRRRVSFRAPGIERR